MLSLLVFAYAIGVVAAIEENTNERALAFQAQMQDLQELLHDGATSEFVIVSIPTYLSLTESERLQHLPPLAADAVLLGPHEALDAAGVRRAREVADETAAKRQAAKDAKKDKAAEQAERAEAEDGRGASFNFHLDNETRQQILAEKPKVLQSFQAMVPKEMAENEFWGKYCSYLYRKSIKARGKGAARATTAKDIASLKLICSRFW